MIRKLCDMTPEVREQWNKYYRDVMLSGAMGFTMLEPSAGYDENGLRFPVEYLRTIGVSNVFLPLELMAEYADVITSTEIDANNPEFTYHQFINTDFSIEEDFDQLNATAIGNLAYAAMYCKNDAVAKIAADWLNMVFVKQKGIFLNTINEVM